MKGFGLTAERLSGWLVCVYFLGLFFILPSGYVHFAEYRYWFFILSYTAAIIFLLLFGKLRPPKRLTGAHIGFLLFLFAGSISVAVSKHPLASLYGDFRYDGLITYLIYGAIFFVISDSFTAKPIHFYLLSAVTAFYSLIGILQAVGKNPFWMYRSHNFIDAPKYHEGVFFSLTGNADHAAGFLCILTGIYFGVLIWGAKKERVLAGMMAALCIGTGILSGTDSYIVGLAVGAVLSFPFVFSKRKNFALGIVISTTIILGGIAAVYFYEFPIGFLSEAHQILHGTLKDEYGSGRIFIWRQMVDEIKAHPLFGCGFDNIGFLDVKPFRNYDPAFGKTFTAAITSAHNEFLQIAVCNGLLALFFYLCFLACCLKNAFSCKEKQQRIAGLAVIFYLVQANFTASFLTVAPFFMMICAIAARTRET